MDLQLKGKVAIVTGGSSGIGKAIARGLAQEGADVVIAARTRERLEKAAEELSQETGGRVIPIRVDIASAEEVNVMVRKAVSALGRLDILVNDAGLAGGLATGPLQTVTDEAMLEDLNVKLMGYLRCSRAAAPFMQRNGWGRIIHVGGSSARQSGTYSTGIRNVGVVHLSKTLSDELGPSGITSNVVHPGGTANTTFIDRQVSKAREATEKPVEEIIRDLGKGNAIRRLPTAEEVANVVVFLASPRAAAITGEVIAVNGGSSRAIFS